jgi:GWxTD domain-containing protein
MSLPVKRLLALFLLGLGWTLPARAQKLDKEDKKFLDDVRPILLPDEEKTFKSLKDKADRQEFQKIFWARRDPNLDTPANEYQAEYQKTFAEADTQFKVAGRSGSTTDCGRVFILLGKPDEVKKEPVGESPLARAPETWTYRDRPSMKFEGGQIQISFDGECRLPEGGARLNAQLDRLASNRVTQPNIGFQVKDGKLSKKLADLLPKPSPAQALLKAPRQDFPVTTQAAFLKVQDGGTAVLGLVRGGAAAGVPVEETGGRKFVKVVVAAQALNEEGHPASFAERTSRAEVQPDGSWVTSYRMIVRPGKYTIRAGALDDKSGKGSVAEWTTEVPNLDTGALSTSGLAIVRDVEDVPPNAADAENPYAGYEMGNVRLVPRFGTNLTKADSMSLFYQYYDAKVDENGKAQVVASVKIQKVGRTEPVAKAPDQTFDMPVGGTVVGPVPLEKYEPGKYTAQLKITDNVAKKDVTQEIPFEIQ